jgi:hypothetical protein
MKRIILSALLAIAAVASSAFAQEPMKMTVTGTVVSATDQALVVDTPTGRMTFSLDSMLDRVRYNDLTPGTRIEVTHKAGDQGVGYVVTDVRTVDSQGYTSPPAATTPPAATSTYSDDRYAASEQLPATASPLAAVALIGLAALISGWAIRKSKRTVNGPTA